MRESILLQSNIYVYQHFYFEPLYLKKIRSKQN